MEPRPLNLGCFRWRGTMVLPVGAWNEKGGPRSRLASRVRSKRADLLGRRALHIDPNAAVGFEVAVLIERWRISAEHFGHFGFLVTMHFGAAIVAGEHQVAYRG
jgi:hypothetical protein